ncbi:MAG: aminoacyl-tRNA hydrolase [Spirochaeta sp.]|jgi:PTH1 family peptidyl-tRNA hydrolase|nr:aminoacyl-tRNA hydrolase [Spirochaeta sp.]
MKRTGNQEIELIAFLGNPGTQYRRTRHNVGWMVIPELTAVPETAWKEKFHGRFVKDGNCVLLAPETYMNNSGRSVQAAAAFFGVSPAGILVVHDDMETPFRTVSLTRGGGHRGNNGVRSIAQALGSPDFWRLRLGVGRPPGGRRPGDWILERFTPDEEARLPELIAAAAEMIRDNAAKPEERVGGV